MARKYEIITQLYRRTIKSLASPQEWQRFLATACRNFRLPFDEQVLLYAQRPDATAVLPIEGKSGWNERFGRWVNRGATGIAVFDGESAGRTRLKYYFDISDTHGSRTSRPVPVWEMREGDQADMVEALSNSFGELEDAGDFASALLSAAKNAVGDHMSDYLDELYGYTQGSFLEDLDSFTIQVQYRTLLENSVGYMLLARCGIDPAAHLTDDDFRGVTDFNTPQALNALGVATGDIGQMCLSELSRTALRLRRQEARENRTVADGGKTRYDMGTPETKQTERSANYGTDHIHQAGRLQSAEPAAAPGAGGSPWEVRIAAAEVSEREPAGDVHEPADNRSTEPASDGDRADGALPDGADLGADGERGGRDGAAESGGPDALDGADEQHPAGSGGGGAGGADLQLTGDITEKGDSAELPPFLDEALILAAIANGNDGLNYNKQQIEMFFSVHADETERAEYLRTAYRNRASELFVDGRRVGYQPQEDGLLMWEGAYPSRTSESVFSWGVIAEWTAQLIETKEYFVHTQFQPTKSQGLQQFSFFGLSSREAPAATEETPATLSPALPQQVIDEALRIGANDRHSRLTICAYFMKDKPVEDNAAFLRSHYGTNGAGFYVDGRQYALWYSPEGIRIAGGDSALGRSAAHISWRQAAERIRELLDLGRYLPQDELERVADYERDALADSLVLTVRDMTEEAREAGYAPTVRLALSSEGGYPESTAQVSTLLADPEMLQKITEEWEAFTAAYEQNPRLMRFRRPNPADFMGKLRDLQREPVIFTAAEDYAPKRELFISSDEIDRVLRGSEPNTDGRLGVYAFFTVHPNAKDRERYLKSTHGEYSGYLSGNDSITYSGKGLSFSHGSVAEPYAQAELSWPQITRYIAAMIADGRFLSEQDREAMPEYELRQLARTVTGFFDNAPAEHPKPFSQNPVGAHGEAVNEVVNQLSDPARVEEIYQGMMLPLWESTPRDDRMYDSRKAGLEAMQAYRAGIYSVFGLGRTLRPLPAAAESVGNKGDSAQASPDKGLTQEDIDDALRAWNGNIDSKHAVIRYMESHARDLDTALWLSREYGGDESKNLFITRTGSSEAVELSWSEVQRRIAQLIQKDEFYTDAERDAFEDIDPAAVREQLAEHGIVNGEVVDEAKLAQSPFIQQVEADVERISAEEVTEEGLRYDIGDHFLITSETGSSEFIITEIEHDRIWYTFPDLPEQAPVESDREEFDRSLLRGNIIKMESAAETHEETTEPEVELPKSNAGVPPEDRFHVVEVDWYPGRVAYSIWDDQTGGYYEGKDGLTVDFISRWQAEEYRKDLVEAVQKEASMSPLDRAKDLIDQYCLEEFSEGADFDDLTNIGVAFTTITDDEIPIQASVDLVGFKLERYLGETLIDVRQYDSLEALIAGELEELSFDDLTYASEEQIAAVLAHEAEQAGVPLAEQVEQFETEQQDYRNEVLSGLTPDQQRIVAAMEIAGFPFHPTESNPINFGDTGDYPATFDSWDAVYDFINSAELRDTPGLREQVQAVLHPENVFPYAVGDTVYLEDGKPFVIDSIGTSDVHLLDPSLRFPVLRAESRENFLRLVERYPQEQQAEPTPTEQPTMTEEPVAFYPGEQNGLPFDVEIRTLHFGEPEQEHTPATEPEAAPVAEPEPTPDEAIDRNPISVQIGGEWQTFPSREAAEEALYADYKEQTHRNAQNFHITDDALGEGSPKAKYQANVAAIRLLQHLEAEGLQASPEQQEVLSRYVGWGSLSDAFDPNKPAWAQEYQELKSLLTEDEYAAARASTLNAHYTSPTVIKAIYEAVGNMGFQTGNILEPSMGVGNFFGLLPEAMQGSKLYGVELDSITGRIARQLYPHADIKVAGFETTDRRDFFDLAVGNVPFGSYKVNDKAYNKLNFTIHNYFFAKALDQVRPGGLVAFVTSHYTMDAKDPSVRKYLAQRAELLGAIRLPNNAFRANAGTEVTSDILFLQRRERPVDMDADWIHLGQTPEGLPVNSYFTDHPEMVLGTIAVDKRMYGSEEIVCRPFPNADLAAQLQEAIRHISGVYRQAEPPELGEDEAEDSSIPADPDVRNFSYTLRDDTMYYRENSRMYPVNVSVTAGSRIRGMIALRDCVRQLIEYQTESYPDSDIAQVQARLNELYDSYTQKYGLLTSRGNRLVFGEDSSYCLLCSLEVLDEDGNLKRKADMFTKRTIRPHEAVTSVDTASEALAVSISEKARVDMAYMSELSGKTEEELEAELTGVIFRDIVCGETPEDIPAAFVDVDRFPLVTADEYLSGNVRRKLRMAKALQEVLPAEKKSRIAENITALEAVQPADLTAAEIGVRIGANWVPIEIYQQFMAETFGTSPYARSRIRILRSEATGQWAITEKNADRGNVKSFTTYGTKRMNAYNILEQTLNQKDVRVFDYVEDAEGRKKPVLNKKETAIAQDRQELIRQQFAGWIWRDIDRRERLCGIYNETFNAIRPREYDGQHIRFPGMNPEITLRPHQVNAIAHVLYGGNTLLAHEVGAGKTYEMVAAAMEMKRLGLCTKSLVVVPNHITEQWAAEWLQLYPSANILVATKKDFERRNRRKFCARIATGDYDAVIIGHSQFEKIPMSTERQITLLQQQIDDIMSSIEAAKAAKAERYTVKQLEKTRRSLEQKLQRLNDQSRKDDVVTFEELGVDRLFVDESHYFKNLFLATKMRNVGGIAQTEAQKSSDLFMKCRYLDEITGGKGTVFATGTPISNSMVELYTIQRYLQYSTLEEMGLLHFDDWASDFGETVTAIELSPEGYTLLRRWFRVRLK